MAAATNNATTTTAAETAADGPVLGLISKRIRALRKKYNRITQMEEAVAQGKPLNKEQEDVLRSKPSVVAAIDELEKLRSPLSSALSEEITLALQRHSSDQTNIETVNLTDNNDSDTSRNEGLAFDSVVDLLNLLYFGLMFDVKSQSDFTATMLTRTHERGCCLTYDYVTDDDAATDLLGERDLDLISMLSGLMVSRPVNSTFSHRDALRCCVEHATLWLSNSDQPVDANSNVSYAGLRERLKKIMGSDYFTTVPEMKAPVEVAAAAGNYATFQVPVHGVPVPMAAQVDGSVGEYQHKEEDAENFQGHEVGDNQSNPAEEIQKEEIETENHAEVSIDQQEQPPTEMEENQGDTERREQHFIPRRNYLNRGGRGGSGGGRRGFPNGRGGRSGGRGSGYQNGRGTYHDQPGNYYPRHYNNRGRGGRGGGGHPYNNHGQGPRTQSDVGVTS